MSLLITGGTGFLGSYLARYALLEKAENKIVILDKYIDRGRIEDILDQVLIVEGDITDLNTVKSVVESHSIDHIAHFAFILGSPALGQMIPYVQVQSLGTANIFEAARSSGVKRVLFASSVGVYGKQDTEYLTETLIPNPTGPYGSSKLWGEALGRYYTQEIGLEVVSLRFGSTYGLGRAWRGSYNSGLLTPPKQTHYMAKVEDAVDGNIIEMPRDDIMSDWTYAADAAQAAWLALHTDHLPYHLYNVCSERQCVGDFTKILRELLPESVISISKTKLANNPHPPMDNRRLREIGFTPRYTLKSGLEDYIKRILAYKEYSQKYSL